MAEQGPNFDLESRTFEFALSVRRCLKGVQWDREQWSDVDQLLRSSGSVAANYTEANNALSRADFNFRIRLCKKESSESRLWLRLLGATTTDDSVKQSLRTLYTKNPTNSSESSPPSSAKPKANTSSQAFLTHTAPRPNPPLLHGIRH